MPISNLAKLAPRKFRDDVRSYVHGEMYKVEHTAKRARGKDFTSPEDFRESDIAFVKQRARQLFRARIKDGEYKAIPFFLSIILEAVIRWAVRRFLEWRFPQGK